MDENKRELLERWSGEALEKIICHMRVLVKLQEMQEQMELITNESVLVVRRRSTDVETERTMRTYSCLRAEREENCIRARSRI